MKTRKLLPLVMASAMVMAGAAYADEAEHIDFESGEMGFVAMDTAPADCSDAEAEIVEWNGSNALMVYAEDGKVPYIGIDLSSLAGGKLDQVRTIEFTIGTEREDGEFYATSGTVALYVGEDRTLVETAWSVYLPSKNPKTVTVTLEEDQVFANDAQNIMIISKSTDNGVTKKVGSCVLYIDDIVLLDESGNPVTVDTSVEFDAPAGFGAADMSNLTLLMGENTIDGASGSSDGGWGQAITLGTELAGGTFDASVFQPGTIVTVYFTSASAPELVFQSWEDGAPEGMGWGKVAASAVNDSCTIAQYTYEDIVEALGTEEIAEYLDNFIVGDTGNALTVSGVSIAKAAGEETEIEGASGTSDGGWGQAVVLGTVKDGGTFDPSYLYEGCTVSVYYSSDACPEIVLQSWTDGAPDSAGWAKVAAATDNGSVATYTYDDMVAAFGTTDIEAYLDNFIVGDCGSALEVIKVTVQ